MTHSSDPRRAAQAMRLRRLKAIALGISAAVAVAFWSLVGGTIASAQPGTVSGSPSSQPFTSNDDGAFFGGSQPRSLGGSAGLSRPMLRSGGS